MARAITAAALCVLGIASAGAADQLEVRFSVVAEGIPSPDGLVLDPAGNLYVASEQRDGSVLRIAPSGERTVVAEGLARPDNLIQDADGNLYVSEEQPQGRVSRIAPDGLRTVLAQLNNPEGLAFDAAGVLYIGEDREHGRIVRLVGDRAELVAGGLARPEGIAFDGDGNLYVNETTSGQVTRIRPDGTREAFVPSGLLQEPDGIAYSARYGGFFVTEDLEQGRLCFIRLDGQVVPIGVPLSWPQGLLVDAEGALYVSEQGRHRVLRFLAEDLERVIRAP